MMRLALRIGIIAVLARGAEPGRLEGTIRDGSDSVVPATAVSCFEEETGFRFSASSEANGEYHFVVPPGHYKVVVRREGFRAIAQLGVAVPAGGIRRLDFRLAPGSISETITVVDSPAARVLDESDGAAVVRPEEVSPLPLNDRTVSGLVEFAPGMLVTPANGGEPGQLSSLGARPNTNRYTVDGVSVNNAVDGGGWPSFLPGARLPAMTALGTTHDLAPFDSIQEVRVVRDGFTPEGGRAPGGNIAILTKSGTNHFHGSLYYAARPGALSATDWFSNSFPLQHGSPAFHDEGASVGGPIRRDRTFFFIAAEKLDLRQVYSWDTTVPSFAYRELAGGELAPLLNQFPLPNGPNLANFGLGELIGNSTLPAGLWSGNARLDHAFTPHTRGFARIAITPSWNESGYEQINLADYRNTVAVIGATRDSASWIQETRASFARTAADSRWFPLPGQSAGGDFYSQFPSFAANFSSISVGGAASIDLGEAGTNRQDQIRFSHTATRNAPNHRIVIGFEYLQLRPLRTGPLTNVNIAFSSPTNLVLGPAAPLWVTYSSIQTSSEHLNQIAEFAQDTWKIGSQVSLMFGARMLSVPAPRVAPGASLYSVNGTDGPFNPMPSGTPLWHGPAVSVDPAISLAWRISDRGATTLRASYTSFHDGDFGVATDQLNGTPDKALESPANPVLAGLDLIPVQLGYGFASNLRIPMYRRWDATLQQSWTRRDSIAISYTGMTGSGLLRRDTMFLPSGAIGQLSFASNDGASNYNALIAAYRHALARGLQASVNYSWSHSIDLGSSDSELFLIAPGVVPQNDRGPSDFDIRHTATGTLSYQLPGKWTLSTLITARTAFPIDVLLSETLDGSSISNYRPDVIPGVPLWTSDPDVPGGVRLNPSAFAAPANGPGNLGRNAIRGFGAWQSDVSLERPFRLTESARLALRADAFNVLNHPEFADPLRFLSNPLFGISGSPLNLMLGSGSPVSGETPAFLMGGPRSLQLSLRVSF